MWYGPIHPTLPGLSSGHNPVKHLKVATTTGRQVVLFDSEYSYALQSQAMQIDADTSIYEASPAAALARITQMLELAQNAEWQRCGFFVQWREDGVSDPEDGWYNIRPLEIDEDFLFSSYAEPTISVELRARKRSSIGVYVDAKAMANDANLGGVALAALPMGFGPQYPVLTWTLPGANGNILVIENAPSVLRAQLANAQTVMTQGRCRVNDQTANRSTVTEVFWKDHRNINGKWEVGNDLLRYYFAEGDNAPAIDVWDVTAAAWVTMGNYQLQVSNAGPVLPVQSVQFQTISPEEVIWTERRFDTAGTAFVAITNRIRRGSRLIESTIVAASGAGLTGTQSIGIVGAPNVVWAVASSSDIQGVLFSDDFEALGSTQPLWRSIGSDATGTITRWTQDSGVWTIAANLVTAPVVAGNQMRGAHTDLGDCVWQFRFKWLTGLTAAGLVHTNGPNNWIQARFDGANLHLDKNVAGTPTSDIVTAVAATLTTGNFYWLQITCSGTTYSAKLFNDTGPGTVGTQVGTTISGTIADAALQSGQVGLRQISTTAWTIGGAFAGVALVTGPTPQTANGTSYVPNVTAGEPAFCWSTIHPFTNNRSLSIYNVVAGDQGFWTNNYGIGNSAPVVFSASLWGATGSAPTAFGMTDGAGFYANSGGVGATDSTWHSYQNSGSPTANTSLLFLANGAGTYYFDAASVSVGGTGSVFTSTSKLVPGFCYLTQNPNAPTAPANTTLYSGATVPAGTITRIGILCGDQDAQYAALTAASAYAGRWASYNRQRVKQKILVSLNA